MRQLNWKSLSPEVCELAHDAGKKIMHIYQNMQENQVNLAPKLDMSPLTLADLASHNIIAEGLSRLTPDIRLVSEEDTASLIYLNSKGRFWLIDPLDGTKEFLARNSEFTVNIALIDKGAPIWGVVYAPALDIIYWGGRSFGAFRGMDRNQVAIKVSKFRKSDQILRVIASKSHQNTETIEFIKKLGPYELILAGSSLKFCRIAEGDADVYPRFAPTCEWDTAAAQAVIEGAGGYVYDETGATIQYGKSTHVNPNFIAATVPLHELVDSND